MAISGNLMADLILWALAFIFSTTVHEASHAFVAKWGGDLTAYSVGQASLNPWPHIKREPVGMVLIPLISFFFYGGNYMLGWASAPYNAAWARQYPKRSALMALAGPVSNFAIALVSFMVLKFLIGYHSQAPDNSTFTIVNTVFQFFGILLMLNLILGMFNLMPFPPLDGSEILLLFFKEEKADEVRHRIHSMGFFGILVAMLLFSRIFWPIYDFVLSFLH